MVGPEPSNQAKKGIMFKICCVSGNRGLGGSLATLYDQVHSLLRDNFSAFEEGGSGHWVKQDGEGTGLVSMGVCLEQELNVQD